MSPRGAVSLAPSSHRVSTRHNGRHLSEPHNSRLSFIAHQMPDLDSFWKNVRQIPYKDYAISINNSDSFRDMDGPPPLSQRRKLYRKSVLLWLHTVRYLTTRIWSCCMISVHVPGERYCVRCTSNAVSQCSQYLPTFKSAPSMVFTIR